TREAGLEDHRWRVRAHAGQVEGPVGADGDEPARAEDDCRSRRGRRALATPARLAVVAARHREGRRRDEREQSMPARRPLALAIAAYKRGHACLPTGRLRQSADRRIQPRGWSVARWMRPMPNAHRPDALSRSMSNTS